MAPSLYRDQREVNCRSCDGSCVSRQSSIEFCAMTLDLSSSPAALLPAAAPAPAHVHELLADWARWEPLLAVVAGQAATLAAPVTPERWGLPVSPSKLVCVG